MLREADPKTPVVVRTAVKRRRRRPPARTGGHPWWKAVDHALEVLRQEGAGGLAPANPERWSQSQTAVIGLFAARAEALVAAYPNADPLLERPLVMLVDNIDDHLHPAHRQRIVPALEAAFPRLQTDRHDEQRRGPHDRAS